MKGHGRLLSCALTQPQVLDRSKTETRRNGWWVDRRNRNVVIPGDRLQLVDKAQGLKPGQHPVVLARVEVVSVHRERLEQIDPGSVIAEGFPHWTPAEFIKFFCREMRCDPDIELTVIRWRYLTEEECQTPMEGSSATTTLDPTTGGT